MNPKVNNQYIKSTLRKYIDHTERMHENVNVKQKFGGRGNNKIPKRMGWKANWATDIVEAIMVWKAKMIQRCVVNAIGEKWIYLFPLPFFTALISSAYCFIAFCTFA